MGHAQAAIHPVFRRRCQFSSLSTIQIQVATDPAADQRFVDLHLRAGLLLVH